MSDTQDDINKRYSAMLDEFKTTGGPAFPSTISESDGLTFKGMTLRDYFAAAALTGLCANSQAGIQPFRENIAKAAFTLADNMLAARAALKLAKGE